MLTPDSCARILEAGGSLRVTGLTPDTLVRLASIAKRKGVRLEIVSNLTPDSCVKIATAGGGAVLFDLTQ